MMTTTEYKHIYLDDNGVALIAGTTMKITDLVMSHQVHGWSPEELHFQFPDIALSKIYSALAYYWDHQAAVDSDIQQQLQSGDHQSSSQIQVWEKQKAFIESLNRRTVSGRDWIREDLYDRH